MEATPDQKFLTRPEAKVESVESLVARVKAGGLRVPYFQRGLRWDSSDVRALFDSISKGLPVGSLLVWKKEAKSADVTIGPLEFEAGAVHDAWWVVDGQQRLTSLAGALLRSLPLSRYPIDPYVVYFDPETSTFQQPPRNGTVPDSWVALPYLLDAAQLSEFVMEWPHGSNKEWRKTLFDVGKRIREYQIPIYLVETNDVEVLKEIFYRVNKSGRAMLWEEVHDALYSSENQPKTSIAQLEAFISELGWGKVEAGSLATILLAMRGKDVTRNIAEHRREDKDVLKGAVSEAFEVLPRAISFLRFEAHIPHVRLLPKMFYLEIATRFFALHPQPKMRSLELLKRFFWRFILGRHGTIGPTKDLSEQTLRRKAIRAIGGNEELSVQRLLQLAPKRDEQFFFHGQKFDARSAISRTAGLLLSTLGPRHLKTGELLDVTTLFESEGRGAFLNVVGGRHQGMGRILHPKIASVSKFLKQVELAEPPNSERLASHAIYEQERMALRAEHESEFCDLRSEKLEIIASDLAERFAAFDHPDKDRPTLDYILSQLG